MQERSSKSVQSHINNSLTFAHRGVLGRQRHRLISGSVDYHHFTPMQRAFPLLTMNHPYLSVVDAWARARDISLKNSAVDVDFCRCICWNQGTLQFPWWRSIWWPYLLDSWQTCWPFASMDSEKHYLEPLSLSKTLQFSCKQLQVCIWPVEVCMKVISVQASYGNTPWLKVGSSRSWKMSGN